jgi:hypothetical protein
MDIKLPPLKIADEVWVATAHLHREQPARRGFSGAEILRKVGQLHLGRTTRSGVNAHIYLHCVANLKPNPARLRLLFRNEDGSLRLFRPGDPYHPERKSGRTTPDPGSLPPEYAEILDWYRAEYARAGRSRNIEDPILGLRGVGKELWKDLGGEKFITGLRKNWFGETRKPVRHKPTVRGRSRVRA